MSDLRKLLGLGDDVKLTKGERKVADLIEQQQARIAELEEREAELKNKARTLTQEQERLAKNGNGAVARAIRAEAERDELAATVERLKANLKIAMSVVDEVVQSAIECSNIEANDLQEWLVKEGVLKVIPFDPAKHFDYTYETEKGEDWITWSDWYEKMKEQSDE